jgi:hypothetical protein
MKTSFIVTTKKSVWPSPDFLPAFRLVLVFIDVASHANNANRMPNAAVVEDMTHSRWPVGLRLSDPIERYPDG